MDPSSVGGVWGCNAQVEILQAYVTDRLAVVEREGEGAFKNAKEADAFFAVCDKLQAMKARILVKEKAVATLTSWYEHLLDGSDWSRGSLINLLGKQHDLVEDLKQPSRSLFHLLELKEEVRALLVIDQFQLTALESSQGHIAHLALFDAEGRLAGFDATQFPTYGTSDDLTLQPFKDMCSSFTRMSITGAEREELELDLEHTILSAKRFYPLCLLDTISMLSMLAIFVDMLRAVDMLGRDSKTKEILKMSEGLNGLERQYMRVRKRLYAGKIRGGNHLVKTYECARVQLLENLGHLSIGGTQNLNQLISDYCSHSVPTQDWGSSVIVHNLWGSQKASTKTPLLVEELPIMCGGQQPTKTQYIFSRIPRELQQQQQVDGSVVDPLVLGPYSQQTTIVPLKPYLSLKRVSFDHHIEVCFKIACDLNTPFF